MGSLTEMNTSQAHIDFKNKKFLFDVVKRCQDGDTKAMEAVYKGYKSSLFNLAYRFSHNHTSAEDLLQEIFIKVFSKIKMLRSPEDLKSWMYRIAINTCISFTRKKRVTKEVALNNIEDVYGYEDEGAFVSKYLERAIYLLPPKQKSIFLLHDVQGFTHEEIADIMKLSEGTSKSQLSKARMKLREYLGEQTL